MERDGMSDQEKIYKQLKEVREAREETYEKQVRKI
jgi:hypothetical protein